MANSARHTGILVTPSALVHVAHFAISGDSILVLAAIPDHHGTVIITKKHVGGV
jgi:hypothetical protein